MEEGIQNRGSGGFFRDKKEAIRIGLLLLSGKYKRNREFCDEDEVLQQMLIKRMYIVVTRYEEE